MNFIATTMHLENGDTDAGFFLVCVEIESDNEVILTLKEELDGADQSGPSFSVALTPADATLLGETLIGFAARLIRL